MPCFDLSGFGPMPQGLRLKYETAWGVYEKIQSYNINVSTLYSQGDTSKYYWQYSTGEEKAYFDLGLSLHVRRYPNGNWLPVTT